MSRCSVINEHKFIKQNDDHALSQLAHDRRFTFIQLISQISSRRRFSEVTSTQSVTNLIF